MAAIIDVGRLLLGAKAALPHGQFEPMIRDRLPFGESTARRLMIIAEYSILSKRAHGHVLPPAWRTVYEVKGLRDKAEAMRAYARNVNAGLEAQNRCAEWKKRRRRPAKTTKVVQITRSESMSHGRQFKVLVFRVTL